MIGDRRVFGDGPIPSRWMLVGDYCGWREYKYGHPFVHEAGRELDRFIDRAAWFVTNLIPTLVSDGKDVTPAVVAEWSHYLEEDIARVRPEVVVTAGAHATQYFLNDPDLDMELVHGLAHTAPGRAFAVFPTYNPAAAIREPELYAAPVTRDYEALKRFLVTGEMHDLQQPTGLYLPSAVPLRTADEYYHDSGGRGFLSNWFAAHPPVLAIDREGSVEAPECFTVSVNGRSGFLFRTDDPYAIRQLRDLVASADTIVMHAALDDRQALLNVGIDVPHFTDTMIEAAVTQHPRGLKPLAYRIGRRKLTAYLDLVRPIDDAWVKTALRSRYRYLRTHWAKDDIPKRAVTSLRQLLRKPGRESLRTRWTNSKFYPYATLPAEPTWKDIPAELGVPYACQDAIETHKAHAHLAPLVWSQRQHRTSRFVHGVIPFLQRMSTVGNAVDAKKLQGLAADFSEEQYLVRRQIKRLVGRDVNPQSGDQVAALLFDQLHLPHTKLTPSRDRYSTEDKYLEAMRGMHPVVPLVIRHRLLDKMRGTYAERLPTLLDAHGRYHQEVRYAHVTTLRLAEPVMLLVPKHTAEGKAIRKCFPAGPGRVLLSVDLSQIELRVAAHLSQDPVLLHAYRNNIDLHAQTAHKVLRAPANKADQDDSLHRLPAKTYNFAILMGSTWMGIRDQLHEQGLLDWTDEAVEESYTNWFRVHEGFGDYCKRQHILARRHGYVEDLFGYRMYCPHVRSRVDRVRESQERCAQAWPIQSTARAIAQRWIARVWSRVNEDAWNRDNVYLEPWVWLHDDVTQEVTTDVSEAVGRRMMRCLPQDLCIPVTADASTGPTWAEQTKHPNWSAD